MFAIIEIKDGVKYVIKNVETKDEFINFVKSKHVVLGANQYFVVQDMVIELWENIERVEHGYIYNSTYIDKKMLCSWELITIKYACDTKIASVGTLRNQNGMYDNLAPKKLARILNAQAGMNKNIEDIYLESPTSSTINNNQRNIWKPKRNNIDYDTGDDVWNPKPSKHHNTINDLWNTNLVRNINNNFKKTTLIGGQKIICDNDKKTQDKIIDYQELDMNEIKETSVLMIIAKRGSGKITLIKNIMAKFGNEFMENSLIISPNGSSNSQYNKGTITYDFDTNQVSEFLKNGKKGAIILDDLLSSMKNYLVEPLISELFYNSRHHGKMLIVTMQFTFGITPDLRANIDFMFCGNQYLITERKRLYEHYFSYIPSFAQFNILHDQLTGDYEFMVSCFHPSIQNDKIKHCKIKTIEVSDTESEWDSDCDT